MRTMCPAMFEPDPRQKFIDPLAGRAPLFVTLSDGDIRNGYTFKISNMTRYAKDYSLQLAGVSGATLAVVLTPFYEKLKSIQPRTASAPL